MSEDLVALARRGFDAVRRGDFETVREFLDPDVKWHGGSPADGCQNRNQVLTWMRRSDRDPIVELVDVIGAGDKVVVIMRRTDDDGEPELVANLTTFRNGKVVEMVHYEDPDDARRAAGV